MSSGASRIAGDRPVPHIVTELPGPKARAHVAFDETWTSPSLPRAYPIVPGPRRGPDRRGHRRQPVPRLRGRASRSTRPATRIPQVVAAIKEQAAELIHFSASDFYLPIYPEVCRELARHRADRRAASGPTSATPGTEVVEASIKLARFATKRPYIVAFLGAFHGRTYGSVSLTASKAKYHAGFGPLLPGVFHAPYGRVEDLRWFDEVLFDKLAPGQRGRGDHRRADPGRGRLHRPRGRLPPGPARHLRRARHPAHRRRDPVGRRADRQDVGGRALGRRARHPADRQGHRVGDAARRDGRPGRAARDLGPRRARLDLRRQPGRLRRRARHDRAARGRPRRQRRGRAASRRWPGSARSSTASTGSSATSAARA